MKQLAKLTAIVLTTLIALATLWYLRSAVLVFVLGLVLAAALQPIPEKLVAHGWRLTWAIAVTYVGTVALFGLLLFLIVSPLVDDVQSLGAHLTESYDQLRSPAVEKGRFLRSIAQVLPPRESIEPSLTHGSSANVVRFVLGLSAGLIGLGINFVMALVLSIYWNYDRVHFERLWLSLLSVERRGKAREVWRQIESEIGAYLRSESIQGIAAGMLLYAGAVLFNQPYPMLLACIGAVAWLVPWLGGVITLLSVIALWLPSLILGTVPNLWLSIAPMSICTLVVLSLLEFVLEPRIFDRRRYNPLLIVLVSIGLADVIGFGGFLVGPPLAAAIQIIVSRLFLVSTVKERERQAQVTVPLAERLSHLQATIAGLPDAPPKVASLVIRLASILDDAEHVSPDVVVGAPAPRA